MALQLCITQSGVRCGRKRQTSSQAGYAKVSKFSMVFVLACFISCAGVMYIFQTNRLATMGYDIREKEKKIEELKKSNEALQIRAAELRSMQSLELDRKNLKMKKPGNITYIDIGEPVAMK